MLGILGVRRAVEAEQEEQRIPRELANQRCCISHSASKEERSKWSLSVPGTVLIDGGEARNRRSNGVRGDYPRVDLRGTFQVVGQIITDRNCRRQLLGRLCMNNCRPIHPQHLSFCAMKSTVTLLAITAAVHASPLQRRQDENTHVWDNVETFCNNQAVLLRDPAGAASVWEHTTAGNELDIFIAQSWGMYQLV